jgi:hypothetical protein
MVGIQGGRLKCEVDVFAQQRQDAELRRLQRVKQSEARPFSALGPDAVAFFKQSVEKRQKKFGRIAESWGTLVPPMLQEHCALESLNRGTLAVLVDSSSHLYDLRQLLLAGLEQQLLIACRSAGLRKITLKPGRWYDESDAADRKISFER